MTKKQVLYISYDGMTDPLGQSQVLPYLIGLSTLGYEFHLISFEKENRFQEHRSIIESICFENEIHWHPQSYTKRPPILSTLWDVSKMKKVAFSIIKNHSIELVHCRSYLPSIVALQIKRKHRIPFIFDMRGFWADERIEGNIWNIKNPLFKFIYSYFKKKEKEFFLESDACVSLTFKGKNEILSWNLSDNMNDKIRVIPCCADLDFFSIYSNENQHSLQTSQGLNSHKNNESFTIGYLGALGTWYMMDEMLDFFKVLLELKQHALFHVLTKDNPDEVIEKAKLKNIPISSLKIEEASRKEIPYLTSSWDVSLFFIRPTFSKTASSPTKQGELMGMGIPIICNSGVGDVDSIVENSQCGVKIDNFNTSEYKLGIEKFLNQTFSKEKIRAAAFEYYDLKRGIDTYFEIYKSLS